MSDIICVTNRAVCKENFLERIEKLAAEKPWGIILREKDLSENEYKLLAEKVLEIGRRHNAKIILHTYASVAEELGCKSIHMPLSALKKLNKESLSRFKDIGASCHSLNDVKEAAEYGCTYVTLGHIFETDCKKGLPGRGTDFLKEVCSKSPVPVFAIGGIAPSNYNEVIQCGAAGACVMSSAMLCENVPQFLSEFKGENE